MALPSHQRTSFAPAELVFAASLQERVQFVPNFAMERFRTLDGASVGPFTPARVATVPLWVAVSCKKRRKGKIVCPDWMTVEYLSDLWKQETTREEFSEVPFRWLEISKTLLEVASEDIPFADHVRALLKDLREARQAKARRGLAALDGVHLEPRNLAALEINELRPFFSLAHLRLLQVDPQGETYERNIAEQEKMGAAKSTGMDLVDDSGYEQSWGATGGESFMDD